ncbi:MAG: methylase, partial [Cyanobacteria bacterium P01_G01_bin.49]
LNLPFTRNHLPNTINLVTQLPIETTQSHFHEDKITLTYKNASQFFRSLKIIGAGTNLNNQKLSIAQMKQLINYWDTQTPYREINITYHVTFLVVTKNKNLVY